MTDLELVARWQRALGLEDWRIGVAPIPPTDADERSSVDIDRNTHVAAVRFDPTLPDDQRERQVVHELLHVRLAELSDVFRQVAEDDEVAKTWWHRSEERAIERLTDLLVPHEPRREYRGSAPWTSAVFP